MLARLYVCFFPSLGTTKGCLGYNLKQFFGKIGQKSIIGLSPPPKGQKKLAKGQSPPQELEVGPWPYVLVNLKGIKREREKIHH